MNLTGNQTEHIQIRVLAVHSILNVFVIITAMGSEEMPYPVINNISINANNVNVVKNQPVKIAT